MRKINNNYLGNFYKLSKNPDGFRRGMNCV